MIMSAAACQLPAPTQRRTSQTGDRSQCALHHRRCLEDVRRRLRGPMVEVRGPGWEDCEWHHHIAQHTSNMTPHTSHITHHAPVRVLSARRGRGWRVGSLDRCPHQHGRACIHCTLRVRVRRRNGEGCSEGLHVAARIVATSAERAGVLDDGKHNAARRDAMSHCAERRLVKCGGEVRDDDVTEQGGHVLGLHPTLDNASRMFFAPGCERRRIPAPTAPRCDGPCAPPPAARCCANQNEISDMPTHTISWPASVPGRQVTDAALSSLATFHHIQCEHRRDAARVAVPQCQHRK